MSKLILNKEAKSSMTIAQLTCNFLPSPVRHDRMEDRDYLVVPMVILTEGVHAGSEGPFYYPPDELSKTPASWNYKPIVVYHPTMNGVGVSACDPVIIDSRKVGVMMNTRYEKGRLKSEAWLEKDRANKVDERIMVAVEANEMMELSTGVFIDNDMTPGEWNGEPYIGIARSYRPDHLALLPDKLGACSIADGAGFLRNQSTKKSRVVQAIQNVLKKMELTDNDTSHNTIRELLTESLRKRFNANTDDGPLLWVEDVYSNFTIYELGGKLFRLGYASSDTGVALNDETPVEVKRVTEYRTVEGAFVGNQKPADNKNHNAKGKPMEKEKLVAAIVANSGWADKDTEKLMELTEEQLKVIINGLNPPKVEAKEEAKKPAANEDKAPASPSNVVTVQGFIETAPKEIQEVLSNSLSIYAEEKSKLVDTILNHKNNSFTKEDLDNKPLGELKKIANLTATEPAPPAKTPHYAGQGHVPTGNASDSEEPLVMPTMNFGK